MGTRADFYLGRRGATGPDDPMTWLGSISWDGNEIDDVAEVRTQQDYGHKLAEFLAARDDTTWAVEPWPWPWKDSGTTDCAYTFDPAENKLFMVRRVNGRDYWVEPDYVSFEDHEYHCEIPSGSRIEAHSDCEGYPFETPSEEFSVIYPDMSSRQGSIEHILGRSGMFVVTDAGLADVKTEAGPVVSDLGVIFIHAATGVATELAELPAAPGESGYDAETFRAAVRVREVQRAAGLPGDPEAAEQAATARPVTEEDVALTEVPAAAPERKVGHHLSQLVDGESSPVNRPGLPATFDKDVDDAVEHFLTETTPTEPDAETEAAMRAGFEGNPGAQMYASGYAAGEAAGKVVAEEALAVAISAGAVQALEGLEAWCQGGMIALRKSEHPAWQTLIEEIGRRIAAAKEGQR